MKAVIVAAGSGTRFKPYSLTTSKILTRFLGKPALFYHIDELIEQDIRDIIMICSPEITDEVKEQAKKQYPNTNIQIAIQDIQLGPSHAIGCAEEFIKNEEFVLFKYADSIHSKNLTKEIISCFNSSPSDGVITLRKVDEPSRYGIARIENNKVVEIVEKPKENPPSNLANVGAGILRTSLFLGGLKKDNLFLGKKEVVPQEYILREGGKLNYWIFEGERADIGKPWDILLTNKLLSKRFNEKTENNCYIGKNAKIGKNTIIQNYSSIEGDIGENCIIDNSVIMQGAKIGNNCKIISSVIGENAVVGDNFTAKTAEADVFVKDKFEHSPIPIGVFIGSNVKIAPNITSEPGKVVYPFKEITQDIKKDMLARLIIFDADNTIYSTKEIAKKADMSAMHEFAKQINKQPEELYNEWKEIIKPLADEKNPEKRHRLYSYKILAEKYQIKDITSVFNAFLSTLKKSIKSIEGIEQLLINLKNKNYKLAIATEDTSDLLNLKLERTNLKKYFDFVLTSDMLGTMKPDSRYFKEIIKEFQLAPQECIVIGDNFDKDLAFAKEKGALVILFNRTPNEKADCTIQNYGQFQEILNTSFSILNHEQRRIA